MSVISECIENESIRIISEFVVCKDGQEFDWDKATNFKIGDEVFFLDGYEITTSTQGHLKWYVKFKDKNGDEYSATQLYFVTSEEWDDIVDFILNN